MYETPREYEEKLEQCLPISTIGRYAEDFTETLRNSIFLVEPLFDKVSPKFDWHKECILWHGTSSENVQSLLTSAPQTNRGAYGYGFYLTPQPGKADQYTKRIDDSETFTCLIGYRCIPEIITINPHLDRKSQIEAEQNHYTSVITQNKTGIPIRYTEVIVRDTSRLCPLVVITYDLYQNRVGLPQSLK